MLNETQKQMKDELITELQANENDLDAIRDNSGEWIDGWLPIYNNRIIEEWQAMPNEYDDRGAAELGHMGEIIGLMSLDLYLYYSDLFNEVLEELELELEEEASK